MASVSKASGCRDENCRPMRYEKRLGRARSQGIALIAAQKIEERTGVVARELREQRALARSRRADHDDVSRGGLTELLADEPAKPVAPQVPRVVRVAADDVSEEEGFAVVRGRHILGHHLKGPLVC
jgi:hypothetical protein